MYYGNNYCINVVNIESAIIFTIQYNKGMYIAIVIQAKCK